MIPSPQLGFPRGVFLANCLASNDDLTRTTKTEHKPTKTNNSVIFVLTYFLVLVLIAVFEIFFSFSFVLVFIIF